MDLRVNSLRISKPREHLSWSGDIQVLANMDTPRCVREDHASENCSRPDFDTLTSKEQKKVEISVNSCFEYFKEKIELDPEYPRLLRDQHKHFLMKGIRNLDEGYECLDASQPWLCYWILHGLELLDEHVSEELVSNISKYLGRSQNLNGGFGGGLGQYSHLATTYAAINALCILGTEKSYSVIDRNSLYTFLLSLKTKYGSFRMHEGGEEDLRGTYCALAVASLTNILTPELRDGVAEWIVSCQTYEGGFGGVPDLEAHGGYTFCGLAALVILEKERLCDLDALLKWVVNKQMRFEGGFQGRTNKLVDGCYSFWQGGIFPLIHRIFSRNSRLSITMTNWLFNQDALQEYLLLCCQYNKGGLIDKPGKMRDYYHTCYCLSGLSVAQHFAGGNLAYKNIFGPADNELAQTHPIYNIEINTVKKSFEYFHQLPSI